MKTSLPNYFFFNLLLWSVLEITFQILEYFHPGQSQFLNLIHIFLNIQNYPHPINSTKKSSLKKSQATSYLTHTSPIPQKPQKQKLAYQQQSRSQLVPNKNSNWVLRQTTLPLISTENLILIDNWNWDIY